MSRTWFGARLAFLAAFCWVTVALAQGGPPAPTTHPGTKLNFPPTLGGATFVASANHGTAVSYRYAAGKIQMTVQIFDGGRRIPPGSANPTVVNEFTAEVAEAEQQARATGLTGFEKPAVPATCTYGALSFRCIVYSVATANGRIYGKLLLTGYRDNFVKIVAEWSHADSATVADADRALLSFLPALMQ
jgi:hypothetical protein